MKFTFKLKKRISYYEGDQLFIADGNVWDFILTDDKIAIERLKNLKIVGRRIFDFEDIPTKKVIEEVKKQEEKKQKQEESKKEASDTKTIEELRELYLEKTGKEKVPANKKNDEEWLREKILEA